MARHLGPAVDVPAPDVNRKQAAEALNISTVTLWRKKNTNSHRRIAGAELACLTDMHIMVTGGDGIATDRIRAYTEYRIFKSAARYGAIVRTIHVAVRRDENDRDGVMCTVLIDLQPSGRVKTQARGAHPTAAIDKASDRAGRLLGRRQTQSLSS